MRSLVAERSFPYAGRTVQAGEHFEAVSEQDARALTLGHLAVVARDARMSQLHVHATHSVDDQIDAAPKPRRIAKRRTEEVSDGN